MFVLARVKVGDCGWMEVCCFRVSFRGGCVFWEEDGGFLEVWFFLVLFYFFFFGGGGTGVRSLSHRFFIMSTLVWYHLGRGDDYTIYTPTSPGLWLTVFSANPKFI